MTAQKLLDRLDGVKQTGPGRWLAKGKCHDDKRASLSIRELDDGRLLVHCFGGCSAYAVVASVGLELHDLFPERPSDQHRVPGERMPFIGADVLRAMAPEIVLIVLQGGAVARGEILSETERQRTLLAAQRLLRALDAAIPPRDRRAEYRQAVRLTEEALIREPA